ncbi:MAG: hypothetical protein ACYYK0_07335 [Candidatus Eutrophobiaceae bacterium]
MRSNQLSYRPAGRARVANTQERDKASSSSIEQSGKAIAPKCSIKPHHQRLATLPRTYEEGMKMEQRALNANTGAASPY